MFVFSPNSVKRLLLVINPKSGRGISNNRIGQIVSRFASFGYTVTVLITEAGMVARQVLDLDAIFNLIVVCGGDGTLSDVLGAVSLSDNRPPVGYIPMGTANDVATTLGLPHTTEDAIEIINQGYAIPYDLGLFGEKRFSYITAFGAFTSVSYATSQRTKKALGHFAYVLGGVAELSQIKPYHAKVEYKGGVIEDDFVFGGVTNSTSVAGLVRLDPNSVDLGDGLFEILLVRKPINVNSFISILRDVSTKRFDSESIHMLHSPHVRFTFSEPVAWTRDGEPGGEYTTVDIANLKHAVRLIVPAVNQ